MGKDKRKKRENSIGSIFSGDGDGIVKKVDCNLSFDSLGNLTSNEHKQSDTIKNQYNKKQASRSIDDQSSSIEQQCKIESDTLLKAAIKSMKNSNKSDKELDKTSKEINNTKKRMDYYEIYEDSIDHNEKDKTLSNYKKNLKRHENSQSDVDYNKLFIEDNTKFIGEFISANNKIKIIRGFIHTSDNERLFYTKIQTNKEKSKANQIMLHGQNHSGKFIELGMHFASQNFSVLQIDMRGFGYSGGLRFNSSVVDLHRDLVSIIKLMNPKQPLFQYGHSFGATVLMSFLLSNRIGISGVILSAPLWKMNPVHKSLNTGLRVWFLRMFGTFLQDFILNNSVNPTGLTKNSLYIKKHLDDKLIVTYLGTKLVSDLIEIQKWIDANLDKFSYPVQFIHGSEDKETSAEDTKKAFNKIISRDKEIKIMEGSLHEPFIDFEKEKYKIEITEWLRLKLISGKPLGTIKKHIHFELQAKKSNYRKKIFYILLQILYIRGLVFVKSNKSYRNNRFILFFYPLFWSYKFMVTSFKMTARYFINFFLELIREIRMEDRNNVQIQQVYD